MSYHRSQTNCSVEFWYKFKQTSVPCECGLNGSLDILLMKTDFFFLITLKSSFFICWNLFLKIIIFVLPTFSDVLDPFEKMLQVWWICLLIFLSDLSIKRRFVSSAKWCTEHCIRATFCNICISQYLSLIKDLNQLFVIPLTLV